MTAPAQMEKDAPEKLTDEGLRAIVEAEIADAVNHSTSEIARDQETTLRYYEGKPFGNEVEGSSAVVMRTVAETVDWAMPSLMRMLFYTNDVVRYEATTPEAEPYASVMTKAVNEIFRQKLNGFRVTHDWAKAGLLEKFAVVKFWIETVREPKIEMLQGLMLEQIVPLMEGADQDVEILETSEPYAQPVVDPQTGQPVAEVEVYDVRVKRWRTYPRMRLETVPPEEFLCSRRATKLDQEIPFVAQRRTVTRSELVSLGIPWEVAAALPTSSTTLNMDGRSVERHENENWGTNQSVRRSDKASQEVTLTESYLRVDYDGDGYAELRRVLSGGENSQTILDHDYAEMHGFAGWTPYPMPHKLYGLDARDAVGDLQEISSTILRQLLDNVYRMNNARHKMKLEYVDLDSYLDTAPGAPVYVEEMDAIEALEVPPIPPWGFEALQFVEKVKEQRTGIHPYSQEVYAAGQNQTAQGVSQVFEAAMAQLQLLCQHLATGIEQLFRMIPRQMKAAGMGAGQIKVGDEWITYNPQEWPEEMRVTVQVGLSPGQTEQRIQRLMMLMGLQKEALQAFGNGYLVTADQIYGTAIRIVEQSGFASPTAFFSSPAGKEMPEPAPDPKAIEAESKARDSQSARTLELARLEFDKQKEANQTARLERDALREHERELLRIASDERSRKYAADLQYQAALAQVAAQKEKAESAEETPDAE